MNALTVIPTSNAEVYRASTDAAGLCRDIVLQTAQNIQGRKYVKVEGWQAIAIAHGCTASARGVERVDGGVRAIGEVRRMSDGAVIAEAEGFVGEDEPTWFGGETISYGKVKVLPKRADYAIRAMAQTRAISRACRSAFAHVVVLIDANLSTTPAEEVPDGGWDNAHATQPAAQHASQPRDSAAVAAAKVGISLCKTRAQLDEWDRVNYPACSKLPKPDIAAIGAAWDARAAELEAGEQGASAKPATEAEEVFS